MSKLTASLFAALAVVCLLGGTARAEDEPPAKAPADPVKTEEAAPKAELGKEVPDFTIDDVDGQPFQLAKAAVTREQAQEAVMKAAAAFGAAKDAGLDTKIESLSGVKDEDGELDESLRRDLACAAGSHFGLIATEESAEAFKTLGDLVDWVAGANDSPMLFIIWSPNCPAVKTQNDRIVEVAATSRVRVFAVASNTRDTEEHYARFKDNFEFPIRIFPDRDQRVTDLLGGKVTPHFFLLDAKHALRYHGALDNDAMGYMDDEERKDWILDAVAALREGKELAQTETEPSG